MHRLLLSVAVSAFEHTYGSCRRAALQLQLLLQAPQQLVDVSEINEQEKLGSGTHPRQNLACCG